MNDPWSGGIAYDKFMGRWSTLIAHEFLNWLSIPPASSWLDVGCGTGSLTKLILETKKPRKVTAIDSSSDFISYAQSSVNNSSVRFKVSMAQSLDLEANSFNAVVSGLVLNFIPEPMSAIQEMMRVTKPGGTIGIFIWDYAGGMQMLRYFWDAAVELDSKARELDEGTRFLICKEGQLESLLRKADLMNVEVLPIEVKTIFTSFDDYWQPFLGNVGPASAYTLSLTQKDREILKDKLRSSLPAEADGSIILTAKAWGVKGTKPHNS